MTLSCLWACCLCQVFEKKWEHFHQLICMLPFLVVVILFTFPQTASSLSSFSDLMRDVHARACVDTINEGVSSFMRLQSRAFSTTEKTETARRLTFYRPSFSSKFIFLNFLLFLFLFCFIFF